MNTWEYNIRTWYPEEGTTFIGNGYIGGNLPIDGHGAEGNRYAMALAAFYVGSEENSTTAPHWLNVPMKINNQPPRTSWVNFQTILSMKEGIFSTAYFDVSQTVRVESETFCHRDRRHIAAYKITVRAIKDADVDLSPQLDATRCSDRPKVLEPKDAPNYLSWTLDWSDAANQVGQAIHLEMSKGATQESIQAGHIMGSRFSLHLKAGESVALFGIVSTVTGKDPATQAVRELDEAIKLGYAALRDSHVKAMEKLWEPFNIQIANPYIERKARGMMFYLLSGYREDVVHGGTATGLSSKGSWGGSVFWDTEFYMFPALLPFYPNLARNMLLYRYQTLPVAKQNATEREEKGARFAWQSKKTGRGFAGSFEDERHISTDIAYCCWWYGNQTGDTDFMEKYGREIIVEVARNCACRTSYNQEKDRYEIHGVIPADEHVWDHYVGKPINNSVMTNAYARWCMNYAATLNCPGGPTEEERKNWRAMAEKMWLPRDQKNNIYAEYDTYNGHPTKQADVGHMYFPLAAAEDAEDIRRNVYYYAQREHETGLYLTHSPYVYAAGLSRAGDVDGVEFFLRLSDRNAVGPFEMPRESNYGGGVVVTGAGSFLNLLFYGVLGLNPFGNKLAAHPTVPTDVQSINLNGIFFGGRRFMASAESGGKAATISPS